MIPFVFFAGLAAGFTRLRWWVIPLAATFWGAVLLVQVSALWYQVLGGIVVAALNAAAGAVIGWGVLRLVARLRPNDP